MTPDLHQSGADVRLGGSRLAGVSGPPAAHRPAMLDGMPVARLAKSTRSANERVPARSAGGAADRGADRDSDKGSDLENAEVSGPALTVDSQQLDQIASLFKLLSDKTRLAILQILCDGEMNVTALCRRLQLPQPTVSHHLGLLRMNRMIANRRNGKQVHYRLHERVKPVMLPQGDDGKVKLDGTTKEVGEHPTGVQIVDDGFAVQIITHRGPAGTGLYAKFDAPVGR